MEAASKSSFQSSLLSPHSLVTLESQTLRCSASKRLSLSLHNKFAVFQLTHGKQIIKREKSPTNALLGSLGSTKVTPSGCSYPGSHLYRSNVRSPGTLQYF